MQNDMTKGSPLRLIIFFTIPVLLGNIFQNVYNLMDSVIVGRFLGVNALAAVGTTGTLAFVVFGWITGMTGGFGILLAQSFGAGDEKTSSLYGNVSLSLHHHGGSDDWRTSSGEPGNLKADEHAGYDH